VACSGLIEFASKFASKSGCKVVGKFVRFKREKLDCIAKTG
jgi:hypothetical protein